ncbi:MAG: SpoIIE family protein phosphatase [Calditrichaceae bacterium]|nr:SpoIIE family protein phosphatase [Calditrichaceae bacterium]
MFKNVKKEEITIPAQMSYLIQIRDFIEHIGKKYRFDDKVVNSFKLVIDEACTNVIRHGYRDIKNGEITLKAIIRRLSLTIVIIDQGKTYDPRQAQTPDLAKYVDIGKKGGLGIMMMRKLMDDLQYAVTERGNEFRLTKFREQSHEAKIVQWWHELNLRTKYSIGAVTLFTVIVLLVMLPMISSVDENVRSDVLNSTSAACKSLADNLVEDVLNDNNIALFEKAHIYKNNYSDVVEDVFVIDNDNNILAWGDLNVKTNPGIYKPISQDAAIDTLNNVRIAYTKVSDSLTVFEITSDILLGENTRLGKVHAWINDSSIHNLAESRKINIIIIFSIILILGSVLLFFLIRKILFSFNSLADWVRQVVQGKVDQDEIDIDASDELGEIAQAFNEMTNKFREAQVNLMEQQKLQKELQVAQEIQQMLLPSDFPKVDGYDIGSYYEAAKEVGGDLFDFVEVDEDTIGVCVADVSGKGVPGSLIMTMIRTALRLESRGNKNPAEVLAKVNRFVADDMKRGMFVTMFYLVLDSRNRIIHYASAGHNPMILYRGSSKQTYYLNPSGFPVGIQLPDLTLFDKKIETDAIRLLEDDILVLYTDGITEAMNQQRELFREERFLDSIRRNSHMDVGEFVKSINAEIKNFTGGAPQNDDITFVAIKEKLMQADIIYNIQTQLMELIDNGIKVKDALEQLRVSPHHYYKYKDIIDRKGLKGLKDFLHAKDYIESKHLSIEIKTKVFDIIKKHPDYGVNRITTELRTEEYGKIRIDSGLLYKELKKLRLNTQELRERYLEKGGRKRLKQPGTPLLTLDGSVIMDYESAEKEIAKRRGIETPTPLPGLNDAGTQGQEIKQTVRTLSTISQREKEEAAARGKILHKPAITPESHKKIISPAEVAKDIDKAKLSRETKVKSKTAPKTKEKKAIPKVKVEVKPEPSVKKPIVIPEQEQSIPETEPTGERLEIKDNVLIKADEKQLNIFYNNVEDDLKAIETLAKGLSLSESLKSDVKKMNMVMRIMLKHPSLKELDDVRRVFENVQQITQFCFDNFEQLDKNDVTDNLKDLLFYLEKDNKFQDYDRYFENVNRIGLVLRRLQNSINAEEKTDNNEIEIARQKLTRKNFIQNKKLLQALVQEKTAGSR